jgi:signal peptidase II
MEPASPAPPSRRRTIIKWSLFVVVAAIALGLDLLTKHLAEQNLVLGETDKILSFFYLERTANDGVAFGLLGGNTALIIVANVVALLVVALYAFMERRVFLAGIAGGAVIGGSLGNMVQRITGDGHVTDFLKFPHWPNFNLADVFIDAGIAVIVLGLIVEAVRAWRAGRQTPAAH